MKYPRRQSVTTKFGEWKQTSFTESLELSTMELFRDLRRTSRNPSLQLGASMLRMRSSSVKEESKKPLQVGDRVKVAKPGNSGHGSVAVVTQPKIHGVVQKKNEGNIESYKATELEKTDTDPKKARRPDKLPNWAHRREERGWDHSRARVNPP